MAGDQGLVNPQIEINDNVYSYIPGSLKVTLGVGEKTVRPLVVGPNTVEYVTTQDSSTKKSKVSLEMAVTNNTVELVKELGALLTGSSIKLSEGSTALSFANMVLINDPETPFEPEGAISFEFEGEQAV